MKTEWHDWYAWRPVLAKDVGLRLVWLQTIQRKYVERRFEFGACLVPIYRIKPKPRVLTDEQVCELVEDTVGTCIPSIEERCMKLFDVAWDTLTPADLSAIDDRVFLCEGCGWYHAEEDLHDYVDGGLYCRECCVPDDED